MRRCRWTVILYFLTFYGHTSSQPVTDSENARPARQLDFGECCPCPGAGQANLESWQPTDDGTFARTKDQDDCPCRNQHPDTEGASSIFFPSSMRSDGAVVRQNKKDDHKPLLHPEVDLASSVLQTLREATDIEYEDALARDAARSMAKVAEESLFGDAIPEASTGSIVTIIVSPKHTDSLDDDVSPHESHVQESRCIHAPLEDARTNLDKMHVAPKPRTLLHDIFRLPRINKPTGGLHRNLLDMDSGVGASNIQEHVVHSNSDLENNVQGIRKYAPLMKLDKDMKGALNDDDCNTNKERDFKIPFMNTKLKDLISSRSSPEGESKVNSLPLIPKLRSTSLLSNAKGKSSEDLSLSPSNIHEQAKKSFFQTKSHLENILRKTRPDGLKNLLKLKDVEMVPIKDLVQRTTQRPILKTPKLMLPALFNKENNPFKNPFNTAKTTEFIEKVPRKSKVDLLDHEVSPSNVIEQRSEDNNCNNEVKTAVMSVSDEEDRISSAETINRVQSHTGTETTTSGSDDVGNTQSDELNSENCSNKPIPVTEQNFPQSLERSLNSETQDNEVDTFEDGTPQSITEVENREYNVSNEDDCPKDVTDLVSNTDTSNSINYITESKETEPENFENSLDNKNIATEEPCGQEQTTSENPLITSTPQVKYIKPISLEKTLSDIKENIIKKLENLKYPRATPKIPNDVDQPTADHILETKESLNMKDENVDPDCHDEESIRVTTIKPDICDDSTGGETATPDKVSMQDLQKLSDSMLQQETKNMECREPSQEVNEQIIPTEINNGEFDNTSSDIKSASEQNVVLNPPDSAKVSDKSENNIENTCQNNFVKQEQALVQPTDANSEASEVMINRIPQNNDIVGSPLLNKVVQPNNIFNLLNNPISETQDVTNLSPIPSFDEIKQRLTGLFDKNARDAEEFPELNVGSMTDTSNMAADASTTTFKSRPPPLRLEDVDLDILRLKPQSSLLSKIPKIDLHSIKTKLPLPTDLRLKPIKLYSSLEDNGNMLGATLTVGRNNLRKTDKGREITRVLDNPFESIPNLDELRTRFKTNSQKLGNSRMPDLFTNSVISNSGIGDLSENINSHAKNTLRSMQNTLKSKFREAPKRPVNSNDLLEAISRNHEDFNDKLHALHVDLNDRIETMRNSFMDKWGSESRNTKPNIKSFNTFSTQNKDKKTSPKTPQPKRPTSRGESKKILKSGNGSSQRLSSQKFKMPTAASVPVPRTVEVPELKKTLNMSPGLPSYRTSSINRNIPNLEVAPLKESSASSWNQPSKDTNIRLGEKINPFKDSKITVSFSTTPRPPLPSRFQSRKSSTPSSNLGNTSGMFRQKQDYNESPSAVSRSVIPSPNTDTNSVSRQTGRYDESSRHLDEIERPIKNSRNLQSWPKVSENGFLSKVKEAVQARLSKNNSPISLKQSDPQSVERSILSKNTEVKNLNTDMTRAASENINIVEGQALKENVSYKCTMVCKGVK